MPVDQNLFESCITEHRAPNWLCPTCSGGHYRLSSLKYGSTAESQRNQGQGWFLAENDEFRFVATLTCDNENCKDFAVVAGKGEVEEGENEDGERYWDNIFYPNYFLPSPRLIEIPKNCPKDVSGELLRSFNASWGDYSSAGNSIRCAAERLLDSLGVANEDEKGKLLFLHRRIELLKDAEQDVKKSLLAIKILGNHGSHSNELTRRDVFDALNAFEYVLQKIYKEKQDEVKKRVDAINSKNGPISTFYK